MCGFGCRKTPRTTVHLFFFFCFGVGSKKLKERRGVERTQALLSHRWASSPFSFVYTGVGGGMGGREKLSAAAAAVVQLALWRRREDLGVVVVGSKGSVEGGEGGVLSVDEAEACGCGAVCVCDS